MTRRILLLSVALLGACSLQRWQPMQTSAAPAMDDHMAHMSAADMAAPHASASSAQGMVGFPASNNSADARLKASNRHSEWVKIAWEPGSKDSLMAWVVYPSTKTKAPVVVVVHEIFGLSTWVRGVADQVAAEGFIAIAPDLNSRVRGGPSTVELTGDSARKIISGVNMAERTKGVIASANYAMQLPAATQKYAVIGYCWGGSTVWGHAVNGGVAGFSGGVAFYGAPFMNPGMAATATMPAMPATVAADSLAKIKVPVMLLNGSKDGRIGNAMPAVDSIMKAMKKDYFGKNYEGAEHGFLRAQDDQKNPRDEAGEIANVAAVKDGWPRTIAFLKKNLGVK